MKMTLADTFIAYDKSRYPKAEASFWPSELFFRKGVENEKE